MQLKELIESEINQLPEEYLAELYDIIKLFASEKSQKKTGILSKLKKIKIQGPKDFSETIL